MNTRLPWISKSNRNPPTALGGFSLWWRVLIGIGVLVFDGDSLSTATGSFERTLVSEGRIAIPTYAWGPDDRFPHFRELERTVYYPYPRQDVVSPVTRERTYKTLVLENEFLRITCLPELGGRIHGIFDKVAGEDAIYTNPVIKPGTFGLRGLYIADGVEWNSGPQGHTVTGISPVDVTSVTREDGSASLLIGNIDRVHRTRWTVDLRLDPGRSSIELAIRQSNPTDSLRPAYFWTSFCFPETESTELVVRKTLCKEYESGTYFEWPTFEGKDLSRIEDYPRPLSVYPLSYPAVFFGVYDSNRDRGLVHYNPDPKVRGRKTWVWGPSEWSKTRVRNVMEPGHSGHSYCEIQSGPISTQEEYPLLAPHESLSWKEWWVPIRGLGGPFDFANREVSVRVVPDAEDSSSVELRVFAAARFLSSNMRLRSEVGEALEENVDLQPGQVSTISFAGTPKPPWTVELVSGAGETIASFAYPEPDREISLPEEAAEPETPSPERLLATALHHHGAGKRETRESYEKCLEKDPGSITALRNLAVLDLDSGLTEKAVEGFRAVLAKVPDDFLARYFLGAAVLRDTTATPEEALRCAMILQELDAGSSLGFDLEGRCRFRLGDRAGARSAFRNVVQRDSSDLQAWKHLLVALWKSEDARELDSYLVGTPAQLELSPLVAWIASNADDSKSPFTLEALGEPAFVLAEETFLLADLGLFRPARDFLEHSLRTLARERPSDKIDPVAGYLLRYLRETVGEESSSEPRTEDFGWEYAFPSRPETIPVLRRAIERDPEDAPAHLLLGNLLAGLDRSEEAASFWESAIRLDSSLVVARRSLGAYHWKKTRDLKQAARVFREAVRLAPDVDTLNVDLAQTLYQDRDVEGAVAVLESFPLEKIERCGVLQNRAKIMVEAGRFREAARLYSEEIVSRLGAREFSHTSYSDAHLGWGKELLEAGDPGAALIRFEACLVYPQWLGVGPPATPRDAKARYWKGIALDRLGRAEEARAAWKRGVENEEGDPTNDEFRANCQEALDDGPPDFK